MRNFIGFLIIIVGLGLLLEAAGVSTFADIAGYFWPVAIIAVGLFAYRSNPRQWVGPVIIVLVGAIMLFDQMEVLPNSAWSYFWPLVIIFFGLRILFNRKSKPPVKQVSGELNSFALFSGTEEKASGPFSGGSATAWFGGVKLDLRDADIKDGATVQVWAAFGGVEILLPKSVKATATVTPLFGGAENKTQPNPDAKTNLKISGTALFGGVGLKN